MLRRNPTRIELRIDDIQEYENYKKQLEETNKRGSEAAEDASHAASNGAKTSLIASPLKTRSHSAQERLRSSSTLSSSGVSSQTTTTTTTSLSASVRVERTASS